MTAADSPVHVVGLLAGRPVGAEAEKALAAAHLVAGGTDQLAAVADLLAPGVETTTVAGGLAALDDVAAHPGPVCVLASGDPGFHGITRALAARVGADRLVVHPAPTSVSLAFARLGLAWDDAVVETCHTGDPVAAARLVARVPVAAVLCGPAAPPEALGAALVAEGAHHPTVVVATRLGEPGEVVHRLADVAALAAGAFDHRSVVVLTHPRPEVRPAVRPTSAFHHRAGMITKPEVRSVVLAHLDLPPRGVFWDIGAGSGSVAIDAALAAPGLRVITIERDPAAVDAIVTNAAALGAIVEVVSGPAPEALVGLPPPDRVFVGGGGLGVLDASLQAAARVSGAQVVATYAAVDRALEARARLGNLVQIGVDRASELPDGGVRFVADNPVFVAWGPATSSAVPGSAAAAAPGVVRVVGLGPGSPRHRTPAAVSAVRSADAVVGYAAYLDAAAPLLRPDQQVVRSTMGAEAARAAEAIALARTGKTVAVVSSGDPGVFAMASVTLELAAAEGVTVEVVPGVTSAHASAAVVGAPLAGSHAAISLSDLLVPWERIEAQLRAAATSGMAIALFNPRSKGRPDHLERARALLAEVLPPDTPVTVVTDATGPAETVTLTDLVRLDPTIVGMRSMVLVGTPDTAVLDGRVVTRRHHPRPAPTDPAPTSASAPMPTDRTSAAPMPFDPAPTNPAATDPMPTEPTSAGTGHTGPAPDASTPNAPTSADPSPIGPTGMGPTPTGATPTGATPADPRPTGEEQQQ